LYTMICLLMCRLAFAAVRMSDASVHIWSFIVFLLGVSVPNIWLADSNFWFNARRVTR